MKKLAFAALGLFMFALIYLLPSPSAAIDGQGTPVTLSSQGQSALALFALAVVWWGFEVIPIGITGIAIAAGQALLSIRDARAAFVDFLDPSIWFIMASLVIGMAFTKTGLTRRAAYRIVAGLGERTDHILLGCFAIIALLTLVVAHSVVMASVFPLLMAINNLYDDSGRPTRFGKSLFIGAAYVTAAASVITLLGSARAVISLGFFNRITGLNITFFGFIRWMFPLGALMVMAIWLLMRLLYAPEKKTIPGLADRSRQLHEKLGPITVPEVVTLLIVLSAIAALGVFPLWPSLARIPMSAVLLISVVLFFLLRILTIEDLERMPWNIVLLFGGAMSMGYCLLDTGADQWLAWKLLNLRFSAPTPLFISGFLLLGMLLSNAIANVAVIAILMPVLLIVGRQVGMPPQILLFALLGSVGMPFLLLLGAAPNAIASESKQFSQKEFFGVGLIASAVLMGLLMLFVTIVWPWMTAAP